MSARRVSNVSSDFEQGFFGPPNSDDEDEASRSSTAALADPDDPDDPDDDASFSCPQHPDQVETKFTPTRTQQPTVGGRLVSLVVVQQPEEQHRARYMSEGSRGAIKGRHGASHCTVQLVGYNRATRLEVYAGTGAGPLGPHLLYRAIPVVGKGGSSLTTPCTEVTAADGLTCVQLTLRPDHKMTAVLDCVGILKICGHEMKRRLPKTAKNTSIRLVFRAFIPGDDGRPNTVVQTLSEPISCVQQLGYPEVAKVSLTADSVKGGSQLFVLGKNFDKNTKVIFREWDAEGALVWTSEAKIDKRLLHTCHLVCDVPTYKSLSTKEAVEVSMTIECASKNSHPQPFVFHPVAETEGTAALEEAKPSAHLHQEMWAEYPPPPAWDPATQPPTHNYLSSVIQMLEEPPSSSYSPNFEEPQPKRPCARDAWTRSSH